VNFLKKGPDLKLSDLKLSNLKVPGVLQDIYYDLKDRHLLPVAAVLIVAIFAVPIAISQSSGSEESEATETGVAGATASTSPSQAAQLVAKSSPGLRDYRRRLKQLRAKDPFAQQYTGPETGSSGSESSGSEIEPEGSSVPSEPVLEEGPTYTPSSPSSETEPTTEGNGEPATGNLTYFSSAIDVRVIAVGTNANESSENNDQPEVRHNLPELTMLPSRQTPALVYMGSTKDGKKALMLVSSDVDAVFGDAKCVLGSERCELLAMEPNLPETVVFGGAEKTYKIELRKIHLVKTKDLNRAPLGKPKKSSPHPQPHPHPHGSSG
jgi:hypothetical protein